MQPHPTDEGIKFPSEPKFVLHQLEQKTDSNWQQLFALSTPHLHAKRISKACKKQTYACWMTASRWHTHSFSNEEYFPRAMWKPTGQSNRSLELASLLLNVDHFLMFHCMCSASRKSVAPAFLSTCKLLTKSEKLWRWMRRLQNQNSKTIPQTNKSFLNELNTAIHRLPFPFL